MNESLNFQIQRLRMIKATADLFPEYRPDNVEPAEMQAMDVAAMAVDATYDSAEATLRLGRGMYEEAVVAGHNAAIGIYANMKSRYRNDRSSLAAIVRLPVDDETPNQTHTRMDQMAALWEMLPRPADQPIPPPPEPDLYVPWPGMSLGVFTGLRDNIRAMQAAQPAKQQGFEKAEGDLNAEIETLRDFTTAALQQGRGQFPNGPARDCIDAVPIEPSTQPPGEATILGAEQIEDRRMQFTMAALHATSWVVELAPPGEPLVWTEVGVTDAPVFRSQPLDAGNHFVRATGRNSRGDGPPSPPAEFTVT